MIPSSISLSRFVASDVSSILSKFLKMISSTIRKIKLLIFKIILNKHYVKVFITGGDGVNWSIDKDRSHVEYFIKKLKINITNNIFLCSHLYSVWLDLFFEKEYRWISFFKKILKFKIISMVTNDIRHYKWKIENLKNLIDIWVVPSVELYDYFKNLGLNIILIPFYVNKKEFYYLDKSKKTLCEDLNINYDIFKNKIIIGSYQRDSLGKFLNKPKWQKNPDLLIKILKNIPKDKYIFLIAGPRRHYIIQKCKKNDIPYYYYGDFNYIKSNKDDIIANNHPPHIINLLYNLSDIYIVSSKIEGGPKAILEASLAKTLTFSTDVGLAKDFLHSDLIYSDNNVDVIIDYINNFDGNNEKVKFYIRYNYNRVEKVLNEDTYQNYYKKLFSLFSS